MFGVTILGNNSALPAYDRHPTSQVVTLGQHQFLLDCGEGTQMQLSRYKVRRSRINHIFISHLHGDHYFGLPGLITSMGLLGRETDLHLYANEALKIILDNILLASSTTLPFTIHFHPLCEEGIIVDDEKFSVETFKVYHRIETWGFIFREKKNLRKIDKDKVKDYALSSEAFDKLKVGEDVFTIDGQPIANDAVTTATPAPLSYAFCADTRFDETLADKVKNVSLLYHETTYLQDLSERALLRFHATTIQAGQIALQAKVGRLIIGHFSSKYEKLDQFLHETSEIFADTELAIEGCTYRVF